MAEVKWTKEQESAIYDKGSNILVAAAAGSGKTAVLVERILHKIVDEKIEAATIERIIQRRAKKMLEELKLFDVYRSEKLGENKKSMAYSLKFRSNEKTLTDEEINATIDNIILDLKKEAKAELRS